MIKGLAHVCFHVPDLAVAEAFYCDKLGFRRAFDFVNDQGRRIGVDLHISGRNFLELFRSEVTPPQPSQSYRHLCLEVEDMPAAVEALRGMGIEVTDPSKGSEGSWQVWLSDPYGNRIELHCYTTESKQVPWMG